MKILEFQKRHLVEYQKFLKSEMGKDFLLALENLRMVPTCDQQPHQVAYRLGGIAGYEECLSMILRLSQFNEIQKNPDMNYGHKKPEPETENTK